MLVSPDPVTEESSTVLVSPDPVTEESSTVLVSPDPVIEEPSARLVSSGPGTESSMDGVTVPGSAASSDTFVPDPGTRISAVGSVSSSETVEFPSGSRSEESEFSPPLSKRIRPSLSMCTQWLSRYRLSFLAIRPSSWKNRYSPSIW